MEIDAAVGHAALQGHVAKIREAFVSIEALEDARRAVQLSVAYLGRRSVEEMWRAASFKRWRASNEGDERQWRTLEALNEVVSNLQEHSFPQMEQQQNMQEQEEEEGSHKVEDEGLHVWNGHLREAMQSCCRLKTTAEFFTPWLDCVPIREMKEANAAGRKFLGLLDVKADAVKFHQLALMGDALEAFCNGADQAYEASEVLLQLDDTLRKLQFQDQESAAEADGEVANLKLSMRRYHDAMYESLVDFRKLELQSRHFRGQLIEDVKAIHGNYAALFKDMEPSLMKLSQ